MRTAKQKANLQQIKTTKEAREKGHNGGIKSGEKRREMKTWKQILTIMLDTPTSEKNSEILSKYGISKEDATLQTYILHQHILQKAMTGDKWAIEKLAQITDNLGTQKIEVSTTTTKIAERIKEYANTKKS